MLRNDAVLSVQARSTKDSAAAAKLVTHWSGRDLGPGFPPRPWPTAGNRPASQYSTRPDTLSHEITRLEHPAKSRCTIPPTAVDKTITPMQSSKRPEELWPPRMAVRSGPPFAVNRDDPLPTASCAVSFSLFHPSWSPGSSKGASVIYLFVSLLRGLEQVQPLPSLNIPHLNCTPHSG